VRAVLDPNVLISALLSPKGAPAQILLKWRSGEFEIVISDALISELRRALAYPKLERLVPASSASAYIALIEESAIRERDPDVYPLSARSRDADDDYLLALASEAAALLVSGDGDLLELASELPIHTAASFLSLIKDES
jgi:putative PIN family toxin of toxin-antitoxin system